MRWKIKLKLNQQSHQDPVKSLSSTNVQSIQKTRFKQSIKRMELLILAELVGFNTQEWWKNIYYDDNYKHSNLLKYHQAHPLLYQAHPLFFKEHWKTYFCRTVLECTDNSATLSVFFCLFFYIGSLMLSFLFPNSLKRETGSRLILP